MIATPLSITYTDGVINAIEPTAVKDIQIYRCGLRDTNVAQAAPLLSRRLNYLIHKSDLKPKLLYNSLQMRVNVATRLRLSGQS